MYGYVKDGNRWTDVFGLDCGRNSWNSFQAHHKAKFRSSSDASVAYRKLKTGKSPWPIDYIPKIEILKPGARIRMVMGAGQPTNRPGGWGTRDPIPDLTTARQKLAITQEFKPDISHVQEYEVIANLPVEVGEVGPQIDAVTGKYLPGGGSQVHMLVDPAERMKYLAPINQYPIK